MNINTKLLQHIQRLIGDSTLHVLVEYIKKWVFQCGWKAQAWVINLKCAVKCIYFAWLL